MNVKPRRSIDGREEVVGVLGKIVVLDRNNIGIEYSKPIRGHNLGLDGKDYSSLQRGWWAEQNDWNNGAFDILSKDWKEIFK